MIRVLIVDDQPAIRQGLSMRLMLEPDIVVVGEACDGEHALLLMRSLQPDLVLMDVEMPRMDGIAATAAICRSFPSRVVMLSLHDDPCTRQQAQSAGAYALVAKQDSMETLLTAIRHAVDEQARER